MTENSNQYCKAHLAQCKDITEIQKDIDKVERTLSLRVPIWVFTMACALSLVAFSVTAAWIGYVQSSGEEARKIIVAERKEMFGKYDAKAEQILTMITNMRLDIVQFKQILKENNK